MSTRFVLALIIGASLTTAGSLIASATPSVCVVNEESADWVGQLDRRTLTYCIVHSEDGDIIEFESSMTQSDFSDEVLVDKNITIDGTVDAGKIVFDATSSTERMLGVSDSSHTLTLKNIKFTNADTTSAAGNKDGGAVSTAGDLYLEDVVFDTNSSPTNGGATYVGGDLYLDGQIELLNNSAADGGAIYVVGDLVGRTGTIESVSNSATSGDGGTFYVGVTLEINGDVTASSGSSYVDGGFADVVGDATFNGSVSASTVRAQFGNGGFVNTVGAATFNSDVYTSSGDANNGGFVYAVGNVVTKGDVTVISSETDSGSGGFIHSNSDITHTGSSFDVSGSTNAVQDGGALYSAGDILITGNLSIDDTYSILGRGGFAFATGNFTHSDGMMTANATVAKTDGGVVYADSVNLAGGVFTNSRADLGGAIYSNGIFVSNGNISFKDFLSDGSGGGLYSLGNATINGDFTCTDGSILTGQGACIQLVNSASLEITGHTFLQRVSLSKSGGAIDVDGDATLNSLDANLVGGDSGAVIDTIGNLTITGHSELAEIYSSGPILAVGPIFANGDLTLGSVTADDVETIGQGGLIYTNGTLTMTDLIATDVNATRDGGVVMAIGDASFESVSVTGVAGTNTSGGSGGALNIVGNLTITGNTEFDKLSAVNDGGFASVFGNASFSTITGSDTTAGEDGGALRVFGELSVTGDSSFTDINAGDLGGAVFGGKSAEFADVVFENVKTRNGSISGYGGAIWADGAISAESLTATNVRVEDISALGGVLYGNSSVDIDHFESSSTSASGASVVRAQGDVTIGSGSISSPSTRSVGMSMIKSFAQVNLADFDISGGTGLIGIDANKVFLDSVSFGGNTNIDGFAILKTSGDATIINSTFYDNDSQLLHSGDSYGLMEVGGDLELINSTFTNNQNSYQNDLKVTGDLYLFGNIFDDSKAFSAASIVDLGGNVSTGSYSSSASSSKLNQATEDIDLQPLEIRQKNQASLVVFPISEQSIANNVERVSSIQASLDAHGEDISASAKQYLQGLLDETSTDALGVIRGEGFIDAGSFEIQELQKPSGSFSAPAPFAGPVVTEMTSVGEGVYALRGSNLQQISAIQLTNTEAVITAQSDSEVVFDTSGIAPGEHEVKFVFGGATITTEFTITIEDVTVQSSEPEFWTKQISPKEIKLYAKNIVGAGKVQFFHNGNEVAWVNALDGTDPKLRLISSGPMAGSNYLVRTRELVSGKNVFEVYLDGERVLRRAQGN